MKKFNLFFTALRVPVDFLALIIAGHVAYALRFSAYLQGFREVQFDLPYTQYLLIIILSSLSLLPIFSLYGLYAQRQSRIATEIKSIILAIFTGIAFILLIAFFSRELFESRFIFLSAWFLATTFVIIARLLLRGIERSFRRAGYGNYKTVIIGKNNNVIELKKYFTAHPKFGYKIVHSIDKFDQQTEAELLSMRQDFAIEAIIVADHNISAHDLEKVKSFADNEHLHFLYTSALFPSGSIRPIMHTFAGIPIVELPKTPLDGWGAIYKRVFDIFFSTLLIIITLPLQLLVALILIAERQGGVLYFQERVGRKGETFRFPKFRSMVKDAHKLRFDPDFIAKHGNQRSDSPLFKLDNDPRITKFGKFIRRTSLDELPQFYAVLSGKMSLVGPRPHLPEEVDMYESHQRRVLNIKPGITGLAQISGRANLAFEDEIQLDMHYIENWSPWLDLIILLKTPKAVIFSKGAY